MAIAEIHLFGARTAVGAALVDSCHRGIELWSLFCYSRSRVNDDPKYCYVDLDDPGSFSFASDSGLPQIWISFAPIWKFSAFFDKLVSRYPERMSVLDGVVACSSSSVITKRFSANSFDRTLAGTLDSSESQLLNACHRINAPCCILQPTMIYGQVDMYGDRNLSRLLRLLRLVPVLPVPSQSGLRQPIHVSQLAAVALHLVRQYVDSGWDPAIPERIALGGDVTLTYAEMIIALQQVQPTGDPACRCRLLPIPNRLFFWLAAPLLLRSPKAFEAVLRMSANLSGFIPVHKLLGADPKPFPILPLV